MAAEGFLSGDDYLALPRDPQPWVIRDLIPIGGLVNIYGRPKTGKSFAAIGIAHAISHSDTSKWLNFDVAKHGRVCYLQLDTPRSTWAERLNIIRKDDYDLTNIYFADTIIAPYPFSILIPDHQTWLKNHIKALDPLVVIVDTLREVHSGDENDSTVMKNVISALVDCCAPAACVLLSHSRKENMMGEDIMTDARGSSYIAGRMDSVVKLTGKNLIYKGRSCGENKFKVRQHSLTGLLVPDDFEDKLTEAIINTVAQYPQESRHFVAKKVHERLGGEVSVKTIERRIDLLREGKKFDMPE